MAAAWVLDSIAQSDRERTWLARGLHYEGILETDSLALRDAHLALEDERQAHAATRAIGRRGFLARLAHGACLAAIVGGTAELGHRLQDPGGAAGGAAIGLLAAGAACR
jgi:hypothetical protein